MERGLMLPFTARPKRTACSIAARLATGSVPGSARSTAEACVFGAAPKAFGEPENILLRVSSCACVSMPTTISQTIGLPRQRAQQLAVAPPVEQQRLEVALRAALLCAVLRADAHEFAEVAQDHAAAPRAEAQPALLRPLLGGRHEAGMAARRDLRAPLKALQLALGDREDERRGVAPIRNLAARIGAVAVHGRKLFTELEALALLAARTVTSALEHAARPGALQSRRRRPPVEDGRIALLQEGHAELLAALAFEIAMLHRRQHQVFAGDARRAVGLRRGVEVQQRGAPAQLADQLARLVLLLAKDLRGKKCQQQRQVLHSGVSRGARRCQSVACW